MNDSNIQRLKTIYEGRVQGVGFRATVMDVANRFAVVGQVRNLHSGNVELILEGQPSVIQAMSLEIDRMLSRNIVHKHATWSEISEVSFAHFSIAPTGT